MPKRKKTQRIIINSQSAETFGAKTLKSIYSSIELAEVTDKQKKTKRRYPQKNLAGSPPV